MADTKEIAPVAAPRDPFALLRQITAELDKAFEEPFWSGFQRPAFRGLRAPEGTWAPKIDVFEKEGHLITTLDLPGTRKEDVTVEVKDGHLVLAGERRIEKEEKKEHVYRTEREYGTFYRAVPLPEGVDAAQVKATFANGVLEVRVPLPARLQDAPTRVAIGEPEKTEPGKEAKTAA